MNNDYEYDERIPCVDCWKGDMIEVEVHIYVRAVGENKPEPLIMKMYYCEE